MENIYNFPSFKEFKKSLHKRHLAGILRESNKRIVSGGEADNMRQYLLSYYKKLEASDSFIDDAGQVWDFMPVDNQPYMKARKNRKIKSEPDYPGERDEETGTAGNFYENNQDRSGNPVSIKDGFVAVRRIALASLLNFKDLRQATRKASDVLLENNTDGMRRLVPDEERHKHAYVKQLIQCKGGGSILSLWQPRVLPSQGQVFSLSQIWVVGGRDAQTQVVEVGWQVCPERWGTDRPVLFIYWTADNYTSTGHYNLEGQAFVQTNSNWKLGGILSPVSSVGAQMFDMIFEWFFINKAWWLYVNKRAVGYYPASIFGNGVLSRFADAVVMGGEVSGNNSWSAMGSGLFAQEGRGRSAYVRNAHLMDMTGNIKKMQFTRVTTSPGCYRLATADEPGWEPAFFYGGPGGQGC